MDFKAMSTPVVMSDGGDHKGSGKPSFFKRIREPFSKLSSKSKKTALAGLTVFLVFALALGVYLSQRQTQLAPQAASDGVEITLKPSSITAGLNQEFNVDVFVDTGTSNMDIAAIQAKVNYDPARLELKSNTIKTDFLPVTLGTPQNTSGSTKFAVGANPNEPKRGSGSIATLTFKALGNTSSTQITFDTTQTAVVALGNSNNVAKALTPATVTFGTSQASASPSPASNTPETSFTLEAPATVTQNQQFSVKVNSRNDIDNANLWNAKITFPKDLVEVVSINKTGSFITSWTEEFFSNTTGEISLTGGVTNPGYKTNSTQALMATIVFRAKANGSVNLNILDTSSIYKNSDNTKMTLIRRGATVTISSAASSSPSSTPTPTPTPTPSPTPTPNPSTKGDGNNDGKVDLQDLSIMFTKWSPAVDIISHFQLDFNDDKRINSADYGLMRNLLIQLGVIRVN